MIGRSWSTHSVKSTPQTICPKVRTARFRRQPHHCRSPKHPTAAEEYVSEINKLVAQLNVERIDPALIAEEINKDMSSWLKANEKRYRKNKMVQMPTESNPRPLAAVMQVSTMAGYVPSPTDCGACSMGLP